MLIIKIGCHCDAQKSCLGRQLSRVVCTLWSLKSNAISKYEHYMNIAVTRDFKDLKVSINCTVSVCVYV